MFGDAGIPDLASLVVAGILRLENLTVKCRAEGLDIDSWHRWVRIVLHGKTAGAVRNFATVRKLLRDFTRIARQRGVLRLGVAGAPPSLRMTVWRRADASETAPGARVT